MQNSFGTQWKLPGREESSPGNTQPFHCSFSHWRTCKQLADLSLHVPVETCVVRGTHLPWATHRHTASQSWNPCRIDSLFFLLNPHLPEEEHEILAGLAPEKICFLFLFFSHSWGSEFSCISRMCCIFPPINSSVPLHTLGENCSELLTLGFGPFSQRLVVVPYLTWTFMFSGWEIDLYTKNPKVGSLRGSFGPQWSFERALELFY